MLRIIGLGNRIYGDDGIGPCLAAALKSCSNQIHRNIEIIPLDLPSHGDITYLMGADSIILIDSILDDETKLYRIDINKATPSELLELAQSGSGHGLSPTTLVAWAKASGILVDQAVYLLVIGPLTPSFGKGLSDSAIVKAMQALDGLVRAASHHGYELNVDERCVYSFLKDVCSDPLLPLDSDSRNRL